MTYKQILILMEEAGLSPEAFASRMGISGMTIRRWREESPSEELSLRYQPSLLQAVSELICEGLLSSSSPRVKAVMMESGAAPFNSIMKTMGVDMDGLLSSDARSSQQGDGIITGLSQIGSDLSKRDAVEKNSGKIRSFKKLGTDWSNRISALVRVIKSTRMTLYDKVVAYGALFYLINIFDLIPDYMPVIGMLDDLAVLGLAAAYYQKRFKNNKF